MHKFTLATFETIPKSSHISSSRVKNILQEQHGALNKNKNTKLSQALTRTNTQMSNIWNILENSTSHSFFQQKSQDQNFQT